MSLTYKQLTAKQAGELYFYFFRMIKEAKKEKGADDFLGKVVLKLQVVYLLIFISDTSLFTFFST